MEHIHTIFGIPAQTIRKNIILMPFVLPGTLEKFGIKTLNSGRPFSSASTGHLTIIRTGAGASFTGDAVMYLSQTSAKNIFFLGTCGLVNAQSDMKTGDLTIPIRSVGLESFSELLLNHTPAHTDTQASQSLINDFRLITGLHVKTSTCVSFGSLYLEERYQPLFEQWDIDVIEMECAALFNAARLNGLRAMAILAVSDIPGKNPFYCPSGAYGKKNLAANIGQACEAIKIFCENNS